MDKPENNRKKEDIMPGVVVHICNLPTQKAEVGL
jgi:hypothetical protein